MDTQIKNIENFKELPFAPEYLVGDKGTILGKRGKPMKPSLLWNYNHVWLQNKSIGCKIFAVHRLVAITHIPNPLNKPCVNHLNGDKIDNRLENLEWCTHSENQQHAIDTGLRAAPRGEGQGPSKLKEYQVLEIRAKLLPWTGYSSRMLGGEYGISKASVLAIKNKRNWGWL